MVIFTILATNEKDRLRPQRPRPFEYIFLQFDVKNDKKYKVKITLPRTVSFSQMADGS